MATTLKEYIRESMLKYLSIVKDNMPKPKILYYARTDCMAQNSLNCNQASCTIQALENVTEYKKVFLIIKKDFYNGGAIESVFDFSPSVDCIIFVRAVNNASRDITIKACNNENSYLNGITRTQSGYEPICLIKEVSANDRTKFYIKMYSNKYDSAIVEFEVIPK